MNFQHKVYRAIFCFILDDNGVEVEAGEDNDEEEEEEEELEEELEGSLKSL